MDEGMLKVKFLYEEGSWIANNTISDMYKYHML